MSILLRSLLFLPLGMILLLTDLLCAQGPPPLPAPPRPSSTQLDNLRDRFSGAGAPHPQPAQTSHVSTVRQDAYVTEEIPQPNSAARQASFMTSPISSSATSESMLYEEPPRDFYSDYFDESEIADPMDDHRHAMLNRPLSRGSAGFGEDDEVHAGGWRDKLTKPDLAPLISVGGTLLIVIAAFFLLAMLLRKVSPPSSRPLPKDAFECLGRHYLTQKHQLQLLRVGSRIVLVSVMPDGVSTLVEITDPDEAVSFLGLCRRLDSNSSTEMFRKTIASMSDEELTRPYHRQVGMPRRGGQTAGALDLYSEPDESLAAVLARGRR